jgi:hypothetical protein
MNTKDDRIAGTVAVAPDMDFDDAVEGLRNLGFGILRVRPRTRTVSVEYTEAVADQARDLPGIVSIRPDVTYRIAPPSSKTQGA